jgi:hypothetical protein
MYKLALLTTVLTTTACVGMDPIDDTAATAQALADAECPAGIPAAIVPAADQDLAFALDARGVQIYGCTTAGAWALVAPDAWLYRGNQTFVHHYAGPTWEWLDGSTVVGAKVAGATVDATAIPWLLLRAVSHNDVDGKMSDITSIQRLVTTDGLAPAGACTPGATADVAYTAKYFFYRTKADHPENNVRCGAQ